MPTGHPSSPERVVLAAAVVNAVTSVINLIIALT